MKVERIKLYNSISQVQYSNHFYFSQYERNSGATLYKGL